MGLLKAKVHLLENDDVPSILEPAGRTRTVGTKGTSPHRKDIGSAEGSRRESESIDLVWDSHWDPWTGMP